MNNDFDDLNSVEKFIYTLQRFGLYPSYYDDLDMLEIVMKIEDLLYL